jgi:methionyl-tRNA synthetase
MLTGTGFRRLGGYMRRRYAVVLLIQVLQFDAPIGYPSITANYTPEWKKWWFNPKDVKLYQFMGKDNVYFHTVYWPAVQIGDGRDWTLLHHVNSTGEFQRPP